MLRIITCLILVLSFISSAFAIEVAAPVHVESADGKEAVGGIITADKTQQPANALQILRAELQRQEAEAQKKAQRDGVFFSTTKRFPVESITFFIAIGAVTFNSMWIKSHGDPLAMERHIKSLADPIAHLSFYSFMQAQGYYMNFHTRGAKFNSLDASTRAQVMRRLSYEGMAIGSLASSVIADLGQSAKMCVNAWLLGKKDSASLASCDQAWVNWTVRDKFTQYFPQIISMWVSQRATEFIEKSASRGFEKISAQAWVQKMLSKDALVKMAYKVTAADVVTTFVGGGWVTKSIKFMGKVTRFTGFVAVDHILSNFTYRPINNLIQPALFEGDVFKINYLWAEADKGDWDASKIANKKNADDFEKEIENYGKRMQQWRDHLNMDAEQDLAGWLEMTKKILSQVEYAYTYYRNFIGEWNSTVNTFHLIREKKLDANAGKIIPRHPFRPYPLYGVSIGGCQTMGPLEDYYYLEPDAIERCQLAHINQVATRLSPTPPRLEPEDVKAYNGIIKLLKSDNIPNIAYMLDEMKKQSDIYSAHAGQEVASEYNGNYIIAINALLSAIGNPDPKPEIFQGYSQVFKIQANNQSLEDDAGFFDLNYSKASDLMLSKMLCGPSQAKMDKLQVVGITIFSPTFNPPMVFKSSPELTKYCSNLSGHKMYTKKIGNKILRDYMSENYRPDVFGGFSGEEPASPEIFEAWWLKNAKLPISNDFSQFDEEYKKVVKKASDNYFNRPDWYKYTVDNLNQSLYLPKSLQNSFNFEINFYLQLLNRAILPTKHIPTYKNTPMPGEKNFLTASAEAITSTSSFMFASNTVIKKTMLNFDYMEFAAKCSNEISFCSPYEGHSLGPAGSLNYLLRRYHIYFYEKFPDFEEYIQLSKDVDTAFHYALVHLQLEKEVNPPPLEPIKPGPPPYKVANAAYTGTEVTERTFEAINVTNLSYKQRIGIAAIKGLREVESEMRRFVRMRVALKSLLKVNDQEILADWNRTINTRDRVTGGGANPRGN